MERSRRKPVIDTGSEYHLLIKTDQTGTCANKGETKPENYILCFPSGNAAVVRREAFLEAVQQVLAEQKEFASKMLPSNILRRYK